MGGPKILESYKISYQIQNGIGAHRVIVAINTYMAD